MNSKPTGAWVFEVVNPMGGARATAWRDTLEGSEFSSAERIAREAIQNSVDATLPDLRTEVFVWDKELSDEEISTFKDFLRLDTEHSPSGRLSKLGLKDGNFFERLNEGSSGVRVTIIEDRNTCGLGFDEQVGKDRFEELCLFLGQETPDVDPSRGGSYGFGKTVYQELSDCRTFFVYSEFEPSIETNGHSARLFGCSSFIGHNLEDGVAYTGRAWFGVPESSPTGLQLCKPIVDDDARQLAASLGFMKDGDDPGTSIMIFGSDINIHEFRTAVEDYWWPRILSNRLAVELWENDDYMLHPPEPLDRAELSPYVRCYELIEDGVPLERDERRPRINAIRGKNGGALALKALAAGLDEEKPEDDTPFTNTVALIRSGPRMVVRYFDTGGRGRGNFAGVFVSHADSESALHLSEPPAHDAWNPKSERLRNADPDLPNLVEVIINAIKRGARNFQRELNAATLPTRVEGTRKLEQILADIMSSKRLRPQPSPDLGRDPFQIRIHERRFNADSRSKVTAKVEIKLRDDAPMKDAVVEVSISPAIVLDDNKRRDSSGRLGLAFLVVDGATVDVVPGSTIQIEIAKDKTVVLEAESEAFARDLYVDLELTVRMSESNLAQI